MSISMSRAGPPPVSHLSMSSGSDSHSRYNSVGGAVPGTPDDVPYNGGPYEAARPMQTSPPSSIHPGSLSDSSRPSGSGASSGQRPPSSASSVGMLSADGRRGPMNRDSSRSQIRPEGEEALSRHYVALKSYLSLQLHDEKGQIKPNRARDKLLRLSSTQFMELSTDVYDELIRREDERLQRMENPPRFLLPKTNFHPKRNQARQKLSTLPIERFRQLATDVFFELERRIPRFVGGADRPMSSASSSSRAPSRGGMRPPPPFGQNGRPRMGPNGPMSPYYPPGSPGMPPGNRRPSEAGSMGRPLPKTFQSSTIVPNKSTMVEDDDGDDDDYTHDRTHSQGSFEDRAKLEAQEAEITELKERLENLEAKLSEHGEGGSSDQWASLREELEQKVLDAQALNDKLQSEIDQLRQGSSGRSVEELEEHNRDLQAQVANHQAERAGDAAKAGYGERMELLEDELTKQDTMMNEVRSEATNYLKEMRELSRQHDKAIEQEERLVTRVKQLEKDNSEWRQRYAKIKAQNKSLRASTLGLGLSTEMDHNSLLRQEGIISEGGLIRDTDVTRYQLAVESLLHVARGNSTSEMLASVKNVVVSVSSLTATVGTDGYPTPSPSPLGPNDGSQLPAPSVAKIKARVTGTANSLITATKQHAAAHGLSPVVLLDAAASNLTAAVVQLIKAVRIRPSSRSELHDIEAVDEIQSLYGDDNNEDDIDDTHTSVPQFPTHSHNLNNLHHEPTTTITPSHDDDNEPSSPDHFNAYSPDAVDASPEPTLFQLQPKAYQRPPSSSPRVNSSRRSSSRPPPPPEKDVPSPALSHAPSSAVTTPNPAKKVNGGWFAWGKRGESPDSSAAGSVDGYDDHGDVHAVATASTATMTSASAVDVVGSPANATATAGLQTLSPMQYKPYSPAAAGARA